MALEKFVVAYMVFSDITGEKIKDDSESVEANTRSEADEIIKEKYSDNGNNKVRITNPVFPDGHSTLVTPPVQEREEFVFDPSVVANEDCPLAEPTFSKRKPDALQTLDL